MTYFRIQFQRACIPLFGLAIALASGCATAPKPILHPGANLPPTSPSAVVDAVAPPPIVLNSSPVPAGTNPPVSATEPAGPFSASVLPIPATIKGSEETSILLDNFTAFVASIDGKKNAGGRGGWNSPLVIDAGRRKIEVEFNRGVFVARTSLEIDAKSDAHYAVRFTTDAELFGHNTYCDFWIIDLATGNPVTAVVKASVNKISLPSDH